MFNVETFRNRLRATNETAESIQSTATWILFYKRHGRTIAEQWRDAVKDDKNKLPVIYVANEVVQQCKIKRKNDIVEEFSKVMPDAIGAAYSSSDEKTKDRIFRVVKVWNQRYIFQAEQQKLIEDSMFASVDYPYELVNLVRLYRQMKQTDVNSPQYATASDSVLSELDALKSKILLGETRESTIEPEAIESTNKPVNNSEGQEYQDSGSRNHTGEVSSEDGDVYTASIAMKSVEKSKNSGFNIRTDTELSATPSYATEDKELAQNTPSSTSDYPKSHTSGVQNLNLDSNQSNNNSVPLNQPKVVVDTELATFLNSMNK